MPEQRGWDETESSFRFRLRPPDDFKEGSFRTIKLGDSGVSAVIGRLKGETTASTQSLVFPKTKFKTLASAKKWLKAHPNAGKAKMSKIQFAQVKEEPDGTFSINGVEVFATGKWKGRNFDIDDLDEMAANFKALKNEVQPGVKLGHVDKIEGGVAAPRFGTIRKMYRKGKKLLADFMGIPAGVAEIIDKGGYPRVSVELWHKFKDSAGELYNNVIDAVALLGSDLPEVTTLADINALYGFEGATVDYDAEDRDITGYEYEPIDELEVFNRILDTTVKFGELTDAVEQEKVEDAVRRLQWKAQDIVIHILRGDEDYEGLTTEEKKEKISGVLDELESEIESLAGAFKASRRGTAQKETVMGNEVDVEKLSALETERDEFEKKATEAEAKATAAEEKLEKFTAESAGKNAEIEAEAFFKGLEGKILPAEKDIVEPMMVAALAAQAVDAPMKFKKGDEEIDVVDAIKALFALREKMPDGLFAQVLKTDETGDRDKSAADLLDEKAVAYSKDEKVDYAIAYKHVRKENPDLAAKADEDQPSVQVDEKQ